MVRRPLVIAAAALAGVAGLAGCASGSSHGAATVTTAPATTAASPVTTVAAPATTAAPASASAAPATTVAARLAGLTDVTRQPDGSLTLVDATGTPVTVTSTERIIAVNGDLTETVFALGLGDHVVARDISATYPAQAAALPSIGYQRTLTAETIATFEPTVVLANTDAGPAEAIASVRRLGIPVVVLRYDDDTEGPADKVRAVATVLGADAKGAAVATATDAAIATALADAGRATSTPRVAALYLRGESLQLIFGSGSGIDTLLAAAGAVDVGAELGVKDTQPISIEALVAARPDVIIATTTGLESIGGVDGLLGLAGGALARTPAGEGRHVLAYEDQYLLGFGPRTGELLMQLVHDFHPELEQP